MDSTDDLALTVTRQRTYIELLESQIEANRTVIVGLRQIIRDLLFHWDAFIDRGVSLQKKYWNAARREVSRSED